jgi:hypothetical protein
MKFKQYFFFLLINLIILNSLSCSGGAGNPETALVGQWALVTTNSNMDGFATNLEFTQDGMLNTEATWFSEGAGFEYVVIAPGRMKISREEQSEVINFTIEEDILTLIFDDGYNEYALMARATAVPTIIADATGVVDSTEMYVPMLPTNTFTWTPTETQAFVTATPENTATTFVLPTSTVSEYITPTPKAYFPITNCAASQLHVGDSAYVSYEGGTNKLRRTPDTHPSNNIIGEILPGAVVEIIDGPRCNYGWVLWKVRTTDDETGWTPESDGNEFWLIPIATREFCSDALPSRLFVGGIAFVEEEPDLANRVRSDPNTSAKVIDRIEPKGKMTILEGPECGEGAHWWKVKSFKTGVVGWTMESRHDEYYLAPIP